MTAFTTSAARRRRVPSNTPGVTAEGYGSMLTAAARRRVTQANLERTRGWLTPEQQRLIRKEGQA